MLGGERCLDNSSAPRKRLATTSELPFLFAGVPRGGTADLAKPGTTPITPLKNRFQQSALPGQITAGSKGRNRLLRTRISLCELKILMFNDSALYKVVQVNENWQKS